MTLTKDEARAEHRMGWNIRCNLCGSYGADWLHDLRPGWGSYAACPDHATEIREELARHRAAMKALTAVRFEQEPTYRP